LQAHGRNVAVLSRGYKSRKVKRKKSLFGRGQPEPPPRVVSDGNELLLDSLHASELARNEQPRDGRLEFRSEQWDLDTATFGAEHERDCIRWTGSATGAVADAVSRAHQMGLAADQAEHAVLRLFGTGLYAGAAADATDGINDRMQGRRIDQASRLRLLLRGTARIFMPFAPDEVPGPDQ
jgi:hypothetical protein